MIDDSLLNETIIILNSYIEADKLAEGYGGGSDNPYFKPAKQLLRKLKKARRLREAAAKETKTMNEKPGAELEPPRIILEKEEEYDESTGTYRLKVDWGNGGWRGYGEEPKALDYDPKTSQEWLHFENKTARDHIGEVLKQAAFTFWLAGYHGVRVHTESRRMWLEVSTPNEH